MTELAVDVHELTRRFGQFVAVDRVSFQIPRGSIFGFLGPNGAGKSTTIRMLLGILAPSSGTGTVLGRNLRTEPEAIRSKVGYMSQKFSLYEDLTVLENLEFFGGIFGLWGSALGRRIEELVELTRLQGYEREMAAQLPGGIRQRLALAASLLHDPELLFLDEPTGSVDPSLRRYFWERIGAMSEAGKTVMVTSHYMDEVERCHEIAFIDRGRLIARGSPDELKRDQLRGSLWRVETRRRVDVAALLARSPGVDAAYPSGLSVRFLMRRGVEPLEAAIRQIDPEAARAEVAEPTLEDVFISLATSTQAAP
ncbi:MAG: ABC transporter ATP-binding protein [Armatimonadetes bacterium]|nr:ABC transporter ATP-binding protein [Armatimonadota bacterium]